MMPELLVKYYLVLIFNNLNRLLSMKGHSKKNISFISNQQLIENMRNRSSRNLSRNRSVETQISLIEPRSFNKESKEKENSRELSKKTNQKQSMNNQNRNPNKLVSDFKSQQNESSEYNKLLGFLKSNIDNKKLLKQVQNAIKNQVTTDERKEKQHLSKQEKGLMEQIDTLYQEKLKLKREKKQLESKFQQTIKQFKQKEESLKKENQKLHKLILKQTQMLANHVDNRQEQEDQFRRMLVLQAKEIQLGLFKQMKFTRDTSKDQTNRNSSCGFGGRKKDKSFV